MYPCRRGWEWDPEGSDTVGNGVLPFWACAEWRQVSLKGRCPMAMASVTAFAPVFSNLLPRPLPPPMLSTLLLRHRLAAAASSPTRSPLRALAMSSSASGGASSSSAYGGRKPNRLAAEHSPYLLQHAHNPVSDVSAERPSIYAIFSSLRDFVEHLTVMYVVSSCLLNLRWI